MCEGKMAREARKTSQLGIYTVILRSTSKIFGTPTKRGLFFSCLDKYVRLGQADIYAYAIGEQDVYLVVAEKESTLPEFMKKVTVSFAKIYNINYLNIGKVFKDRYYSEPLNTIDEVLSSIKNINTIDKVRVADKENKFETSFKEYFTDKIINPSFVENNLGKENFEAFHELNTKKKQPTFVKVCKYSDDQVKDYILDKYNVKVSEVKQLKKSLLSDILEDVLSVTCASARQIGRITSVPLRFIWSLAKKKKVPVEQSGEQAHD